MTFEEELQAFLRHKWEQIPQVHEILVEGRQASDPMEGVLAAGKMIEAHNEALLLVARQIDTLRAADEGA